HLPEGGEEIEVLHVGGTDLQDVDVLEHLFNLRDLHHLGHHGYVEFVAGRAKQFQSFHAHSLERVRRRSRFVRAAAQNARSGTRDALRRFEELRFALDSAWSGHDDDLVAANFDAARFDDRFLAPPRATGEFVRFTHAHCFLYAIEQFELARVDRRDISDDTEDRLIGARGAVNLEAARYQLG